MGLVAMERGLEGIIAARRGPELLLPPDEIFVRARARVEIEGWIRWEIVRPSGLIRASAGPYRNIITDAGFNTIGTGGSGNEMLSVTRYCGVGTSNTAPVASDASLGSQTGNRTLNNGGFSDAAAIGPSNNFLSVTRTRVFTEGQVSGVNLAEVGFFRDATGGPMWMRQLIKNDLGVPTPITLEADEQLRIIYEWRMYPNQTVASSTPTIDGNVTNLDIRAHDIDNQEVWSTDFLGVDGMSTEFGTWDSPAGSSKAYEANTLPALTATQTGVGTFATSVTADVYVSDSFERAVESVWDPGIANFGTGVGSITFWGFQRDGSQIATFDPKINKDNTKRLRFKAQYEYTRRP
jgi:hypothetical protein